MDPDAGPPVAPAARREPRDRSERRVADRLRRGRRAGRDGDRPARRRPGRHRRRDRVPRPRSLARSSTARSGCRRRQPRTLFVDREGTIWIGSAGLLQLRGRGLVEHYDVASGLPATSCGGSARSRGHAVGRHQPLPGARDRRALGVPARDRGPHRAQRSCSRRRAACSSAVRRPTCSTSTPAAAPARCAGDRPSRIAPSSRSRSDPTAICGSRRASGCTGSPARSPVRSSASSSPACGSTRRFASLAVVGDQLWTATVEGVAVLEDGAWHLFDQAAGFRGSTMRYVIRARRRPDVRRRTPRRSALTLLSLRRRRGLAARAHRAGRPGLTTGMVYFLGEDRQQRLWVGTGDGVDVVTPDRRSITSTRATASRATTRRRPRSWSTATARCGSARPAARPTCSRSTTTRPAARRRAPRSSTAGSAISRSAPPGTRALEVPHDRNALTLEFAASSMLDAKRVEYQIRLSPLETEWSATHQREARYPALLPGAYRFEVRARIGAGSWGPATELRFAVLPAWWQTRWFLVLVALAGARAIAAVFAWRQRAVLRRRTRQLHAAIRRELPRGDRSDARPDLGVPRPQADLPQPGEPPVPRRRVRRRTQLGATSTCSIAVHPDDRAQVAELFRQGPRPAAAARPPRSSSCGCAAPTAAGGPARCRRCVVEIGGAPTVVVSGRDVTERKRLRAKLLVSDRMASLGTLAAGIAHEINNPLAYVTGNLEAMAEALRGRRGRAEPGGARASSAPRSATRATAPSACARSCTACARSAAPRTSSACRSRCPACSRPRSG